jgi:anaerobic ribonucleoside-triphosphate reductase activating protein
VVSYSGYTLDEILDSSDEFKKLLLSKIDILIDGRYEQQLASCLLWRSSQNQKIHFLTDRYKAYKNLVEMRERAIEFTISEKSFSITGNFSMNLVSEIRKQLRFYGIVTNDNQAAE